MLLFRQYYRSSTGSRPHNSPPLSFLLQQQQQSQAAKATFAVDVCVCVNDMYSNQKFGAILEYTTYTTDSIYSR